VLAVDSTLAEAEPAQRSSLLATAS
jgi:hypothetical protein